MPMQMGFRWYGEGNDKIKLSDIRQIPGVSTIVWALHDKMPGEVWQPEEIEKVVSQIRAAGFNADVVESVNVHDDIKIGLPTRDKYIENYIETIRNLIQEGLGIQDVILLSERHEFKCIGYKDTSFFIFLANFAFCIDKIKL